MHNSPVPVQIISLALPLLLLVRGQVLEWVRYMPGLSAMTRDGILQREGGEAGNPA